MNNDDVTCGGCGKQFSKRRLVFKQVTTESCPFCQSVIQQTEGFAFTNEVAVQVEDVAAIDGTAEQLRQRNTQVEEVATPNERKWIVRNYASWECEMLYRMDKTGFLTIRLSSERDAARIIKTPLKLKSICATFGCEPWATSRPVWGAEQHLSTKMVSPELFAAVVKRLDEAMQAAVSEVTGNENDETSVEIRIHPPTQEHVASDPQEPTANDRRIIKHWFTVHWPHPELAMFDEGWNIFLKAEFAALGRQVSPGDRVLFYETKGASDDDDDSSTEEIERFKGRGGIVCAAEVVEINDFNGKDTVNGDKNFPIKIPCDGHEICKVVNGMPTVFRPPLVIGNIDSRLRYVARPRFAHHIDQPDTGRFTFQGGLFEIGSEAFKTLYDLLTT